MAKIRNIKMEGNIMENKTALITGSTGGLGSEFVRLHAKSGGDIILVARNQKKLDEQKKKTESSYGVKVYTIAVDFTDYNAAEVIYDRVKGLGITVDYLINNAGLGGQGSFADRTMEQDLEMLNVNMVVPTKLMKLFIPDFIKRGSGKILNVSSTAALTPGPLQAEYYASKAYLTSLSNAVWHELKETGVTCTVLMPGAMDTGFASASGLTKTKMFSNAGKPKKVAEDGYKGMLSGKLSVISGLPGWQSAFVGLMPMMPKKTIMGFVADQQTSR